MVAFVRSSGGGYAERVAVEDEWVFDLPAGASYAEGAAFLTTYLTAWIPMTRQARIHPDTNVLVTAAAGGVGTAAIQVAAFCGATVTAAAGSEEKRELARRLGAQRTVTYDEIGELDDIDVAFDPVGGPVFAACIKALRPLGVAIGIGFAGGTWEPVDPARLVGRNVGVQGFYLGRLMGFRPDLVRLEVEELLALWRRGALHPVVGAEYPLEHANEALDLIGIAAVDREGRSCSLRPPSSPAPRAGSAARWWPRSRRTARPCAVSTSRAASTSPTRRSGSRSHLPTSSA